MPKNCDHQFQLLNSIVNDVYSIIWEGNRIHESYWIEKVMQKYNNATEWGKISSLVKSHDNYGLLSET